MSTIKVMLAKEYTKGMKGSKEESEYSQPPLGWRMSEKYDGYRTILAYDEDGNPHFYSRTGKEFNAPEWFYNAMPSNKTLKGRMIDGELWAGRENFQLMGTVRKKVPVPEEWIDIRFVVYDITNLDKVFIERIKDLQKIVKLTKEKWNTITKKNMEYPFNNLECPISFTEQKKITSHKMMDEFYQSIISNGGEGIMIKRPDSIYKDGRSSDMLKYKPSFDREAEIIDYKPGKGKYYGFLGGLVCRPLKNCDTYMTRDEDDDHIFTLSGMDDEVRENYMETHPKGTIITYECSGWTDKGIPRFARYLRKRTDIILKETDYDTNQNLEKIITIFTEIEKNHLLNKDYFRGKVYTKVLKGLKKLKNDSDLTDSKISSIEGIGKGTKEKIREIISTGTCNEYKKIQKNKKEIDLHELFQKIHGVGPGCAQKLIDLGYETIEDIREDTEHVNYLNDVQLKGLQYFEDINLRIPHLEIKKHEKYLKKTLNEIDPNSELTISGSYRRKKKDSGDIDILLKSESSDTYELFISRLIKDGYIRDTLAHGQKKFMGMSNLNTKNYPNRRIDIMYTSPDEYPFAVLYFTGSAEFNVKMRNDLLERGYTLNEYGVNFTDSSKKFTKKFKTEKEIFKYFDYEYLKPEER
uniref:DNA-directed DNA polymerase n=1 Tax=viral metagenome TaxID=1070528 RepID=A0A6C0BSJ9_9ZZZZ